MSQQDNLFSHEYFIYYMTVEYFYLHMQYGKFWR